MPNITVTNVSSEAIYLSDLYVQLLPGAVVTTYRAQADLTRMKSLQQYSVAGTVTVNIVYTTDEVDSGFDAPLGGGNSVEVLTAPGSLTLSATTSTSILINPTGTTQTFVLPDGTDGQIKEIVNGANNEVATNFLVVACTNNVGNDVLDLNANYSARLVWVTSLGGWVVLSTCTNVSGFWD